MTTSPNVTELRSAVSGKVLVASDEGYDEARRVWNAAIDRSPAVIVQCRTADDVSAAVRFATTHKLEIAVRGGAHSVSGQSVVDDGLMIDLSLMNNVTVDPERQRATAGGGALLGELIAAAQEHGLATPIGAISHTGVGGLTLGGGMGWLSRKYGLSIDNMTSATVVTADGQIRRVDEHDNADLFWALRGGGGNFGVVTEFEFALHEVDPIVQVALLFWPLDKGEQFWKLARDAMGSMPPEINVIFGALNAPPEPFVPEEHQLKPGYAMVVAGFNATSDFDQMVERLRTTLPPLFEFATPMPYVALQQMFDEGQGWGLYSYDKGCYVEDFSDDVIQALLEHVPNKQSPLSCVLVYRLDGAYSMVDENATAFSGGRSPRYNLFLIALSPTPDMLPADRQWVRDMHAALAPHALATTYVNTVLEGNAEDPVRAAYGPEKYERLAQIKRVYDPENVFRRNANIKPGQTVPAPRVVDVTEQASRPVTT